MAIESSLGDGGEAVKGGCDYDVGLAFRRFRAFRQSTLFACMPEWNVQ